jgi:hypothetical protein
MLIQYIFSKWRTYPSATAYVVVDMCYLWQGSGHDLDATRTIANDGNVLALFISQKVCYKKGQVYIPYNHTLYPNRRYALFCP